MLVKAKRKKTGVSGYITASRGGEPAADNESHSASTNHSLGETHPVLEGRLAGTEGDESGVVNESRLVAQEHHDAAGSGKSVNGNHLTGRKNKTRLDEKKAASALPVVETAAGEHKNYSAMVLASRKSKRRSTGSVPSELLLNGRGNGDVTLPDTEPKRVSTCRQLQELQRRKAATLKSRIMIDNQLADLVSTELGYHAGMEEAERKAKRKQAEQLIKSIDDGFRSDDGMATVANRVAPIVTSTRIARNGFDAFLSGIEKEMTRLAATLPVATWIEDEDRRGIGLLSLATIIGETGDLSSYANPGKVWRRLGMAPFQDKMPSTWRKEGGLSSEQWTEIGYSPRRRSLMYVIGENIVRANKGSYRKRYDEAKASGKANHPDWTDGHCHNHGMLLATKRLVRDLWKEWNRK